MGGGGGGGVKVMVAEQPKPPNRFGHVCNLIHSIPLLPPPIILGHSALGSPLPFFLIFHFVSSPFAVLNRVSRSHLPFTSQSMSESVCVT